MALLYFRANSQIVLEFAILYANNACFRHALTSFTLRWEKKLVYPFVQMLLAITYILTEDSRGYRSPSSRTIATPVRFGDPFITALSMMQLKI
jgi:hypothetical protein